MLESRSIRDFLIKGAPTAVIMVVYEGFHPHTYHFIHSTSSVKRQKREGRKGMKNHRMTHDAAVILESSSSNVMCIAHLRL